MLWCASFFSLGFCSRQEGWCSLMVVAILVSNFGLVGVLIFMYVKEFCKRNDKIFCRTKALVAGGTTGIGHRDNGEVKISEELQEKVNMKNTRRFYLDIYMHMFIYVYNIQVASPTSAILLSWCDASHCFES